MGTGDIMPVTNVVESPLASVRLRTTAAKRYKRVENATALIWKVLCVAERRLRTLNAPELLPSVYADAVFTDGKLVAEEVRKEVA